MHTPHPSGPCPPLALVSSARSLGLRPLGVFLGVLFSVLALLSVGIRPARAATYQVTTLADDGGTGSLRGAIDEANLNAGSTVTFKPGLSGTIRLASALPALTANMTITGPGASVIAVDGAGAYQPFLINGGVTAALSGLAIQNGNSFSGSGNGGGVYNGGSLTLTGCALTGNRANSGGGVYNGSSGALMLTGCTLAGNHTHGGGGVYNDGTATLSGCTLTGNTTSSFTGQDGDGGGVLNGGTLTLTGCTLAGNSTSGVEGGGVFNHGTATLSGCTLAGNSANSGTGGGVDNNAGIVTLTGCTLTGNTARDAGGVYNGGTLTLTDCSLTGNGVSNGSGGGVYNDGKVTLTRCALTGNNGGRGGGGVYNHGALTLTGCTLAANTAAGGGGLYSQQPAPPGTATVTLTGCTLAANSATHGPAGVAFNGVGATMTLTGCTLAGNTANGGGRGGGGCAFNSGILTLTGCTLTGNTAQYVAADTAFGGDGGGGGGAVRNYDSGALTLTGCTLTGNTADQAGGGVYNTGKAALIDDILYGDTATDAPASNELAGTITANFCDIQGLPAAPDSGQNFGADPLFVTPSVSGGPPADTHLTAGSPCIHVGYFMLAGTTDHDGNPYAAPNPSLGAYESGFEVTNTADGGAGSLRAAITYANLNAGSTLTFVPGLSGTITLLSSLPALAVNMSIQGPGASALAVDGNGKYQLFFINHGKTVALSGLTIQNGNAGNGGGIANAGTLTLTGCALTKNKAGFGGGVENFATATLTGCTLTGNTADSTGGGVDNLGTLTLTGCTLADDAASFGGGVYTAGAATLSGCTLAGNSASQGGGGVYNQLGGALTLTDDILYGDTSSDGSEVNGSATVSHCDIQQDGLGGTGNLNADPRLAPLGSYGGPTQTFALLPGSPCLGAGTPVTGLAADQRGVAVPQNGRYDIGAFESRGFAVTVTGGSGQSATAGTAFALSLIATVTANDPAQLEPVVGGGLTFTGPLSGASATFSPDPAPIRSGGGAGVAATTNRVIGGPYAVAADTGAGSATYSLTNTAPAPAIYQVTTLADSGAGSLRAVITLADGNILSTITFKPGLSGTITLLSSLPALTTDMTVQGPGASVVAVDGSGKYQPFVIASGVTAALSGLTIQNGYTSAGPGNGGGGVDNHGTLTLTGCALTGNRAQYGGGVYTDGTVTLSGCTLAGNSGINLGNTVNGEGGGVYNIGALTLTGCTLTQNTATFGGGVYNDGTVTLTGCTLTANTATYGGGVYTDSTATLSDDILYGDNAFFAGSEVLGSATVTSCDIAGYGTVPDGSGNFGADPRLAPLGDYGGPTRTFALLPGSPCLGAGTPVTGLAADQRGVAVPQNGRYDIGAFESRGFAVTVTGGSGQSATAGTAFALSLIATVTANDPAQLEPVVGGGLTFTGPLSGASAAFSPDPAPIGSGGIAGVTATANGTPGGPYAVAAGTGAGSAAYSLTNTAVALDVSGQVTVGRGGYFFNRRRNLLQQVLTLTNTGPALLGPVVVAFDGLPQGVAVFRPDGNTSAALPSGSPYLVAVAAGGSLASGASVDVAVSYYDPAHVPVPYTPRVLAGAGD